WDADKGERFRELGPFAVNSNYPPFIGQWSPDSRLLAVNVLEGGWQLWDVENNKLANDPKQWMGDTFLLAPDGQNVLVRSNNSNAHRLRELATGKERGELPYTRAQPPAWSPDGRLLVVQGASGIELWSGNLRRRVRALAGPHWGAGHFWQLAFSAD